MRLAWRGIGGKSLWFLGILGAVLWIAFHTAAFFVLFAFAQAEAKGALAKISHVLAIGCGVAFWGYLSIALSQSVSHAVMALFSRGGMDLLLSSPLDSRWVLTVRSLAIGFSAILLPAVLLLPVAHVAPFVGAPRFMSIYPSLLAFGLLCCALGVGITMSLVATIGVQRAKVVAQVVGAVIGALAFLATQATNLLPATKRTELANWLSAHAKAGEIFGPDSPLWWPGAAFTGHLVPMLVLVVGAVCVFLFTMQVTHRRFVSGTQEVVVAGRGTTPVAGAVVSSNRHPLWVLVVLKEWRLIIRDPQIISQSLLQLLYLVPLIFMGFSGRWSPSLLLPGFVLLTATLTGNLAWLTMAGEESPDLIGSSPLSLARMRLYKAIAACAPCLALLVPVVLYWLVVRDVAAGLALGVCAVGACVNVALCHLLNPRVADRKNIKSRQQYLVASLLEFMSAIGWAAMAYGLAEGIWWLPLIASLAAFGGVILSWLLGLDARHGSALA